MSATAVSALFMVVPPTGENSVSRRNPIRNRVALARLAETAQPEPAGLAGASGLGLGLVAGPGLREGDVEQDAAADDLGLRERDERRFDPQVRLGLRPQADRLLEGAVELGPAIGIPRRVLPHRADVDRARAEHLAPGGGGRQQVRVAE